MTSNHVAIASILGDSSTIELLLTTCVTDQTRWRTFERILWSVNIFPPGHFVLFQHLSMEQAVVFHSVLIVHSHTAFHLF